MALDSTYWALAVFIGLAIGVAARSLVPYYWKHLDNKYLTWNWKYLWTALSAFAFAAYTVFVDGLFTNYVVPATNSYLVAFGAAAVYGFFLNHSINYAVDFGKLSSLYRFLRDLARVQPPPPAPPGPPPPSE